MARINVEESLFKDNRFSDLIIRMGSKDCALGALVSLWILGQKHYVKGNLIPKDEWQKQRINPALVECGFAEERPDGYWVRGSKEQFNWLVQASVSGKAGGKKSAEKRKKKRTKSKQNQDVGIDPEGLVEKIDETPTDPLSTLKGSQGSLLFTPNSYSSSELKTPNSSSFKNKGSGSEKSAPPDGVKDVIAKYCEVWSDRWKAKPTITGRDAGQIKTLVKDLGKEKALILVQAYCQMPDSWFIKKRHDVSTLVNSISQVNHFAQTGRMISNKEIHDIDRAVGNKTLIDKIQAGEI